MCRQKIIKNLEIHSFCLHSEGEWALMSVQTSDWKSDFNCKVFKRTHNVYNLLELPWLFLACFPRPAWFPLPTKINIFLKKHGLYFPQEQSIYFPKMIMITSRVFSAPSGVLCVLQTHCWPAAEPSNPGWFPSNLQHIYPIHTSPTRLGKWHSGCFCGRV